ncbi:MAG: 4-alpha-glucanotransferase [Ferruginibacter sp.]
MPVRFMIRFPSLPGDSFDPAALARTKPFSTLFLRKDLKKKKQASSKKATHIFTVMLPRLQDNFYLCITGSAKKTGGFDPAQPVLFRQKNKGRGIIKLNLSGDTLPVEYKLAVYDAEKKSIIDYEPGHNRTIGTDSVEKIVPVDCPASFLSKYLWKGAGVNIPVFSLRTEHSWGTGDFTDIMVLADWASACDIKLIQLLPVNDTNASGTDKDSYPYSAISSIALDPKYINAERLAHRLSIEITPEEEAEIIRLNALNHVAHSAVMALKLSVMKRVFEKDQYDFRDDTDRFTFFDMQREWLLPYAVFCALRDKYGTADHTQWGDYADYDEEKVQEMASPQSEDYHTVLFWYYIQYHLHLQLKEASDHAHKKGILLKGDLPIGVGRQSVDTWMYPELFDLDMQAGAPPDAFSGTGQNWGFPTYRMEKMLDNNFSWFRKKTEHLEYYFDAVRIDHVLGFFRIWSIPVPYEKGTMGRFVPAIPLYQQDFTAVGIVFDEKRYCEPFIKEVNDEVILFKVDEGYHFGVNMQQTALFANLPENEQQVLNELYRKYFYEVQDASWEAAGRIKLSMLTGSTDLLICAEDLGMVPRFTADLLHSLNMLTLRVQQMPGEGGGEFSDIKGADYLSVVMPATHDMAPVRLWWEQQRGDAQHFFAEILEEPGDAPYFCEPWVCEKIIKMHLSSPAMWSIFLLQDLLAVNGKARRPVPSEERINDPADPDQVWKYRMHITLEKLLGDELFNSHLQSMVKESGR